MGKYVLWLIHVQNYLMNLTKNAGRRNQHALLIMDSQVAWMVVTVRTCKNTHNVFGINQ